MPKMNGVEFTPAVRKDHAELPIILLLSAFSYYSENYAIESGTIALIPKPFDINAIIERFITEVNTT